MSVNLVLNQATMSFVYLLLGSNLGDRKENLSNARLLIEKRAGEIRLLSFVYETEAWGFTEKTENFFNQTMQISTSLSPLNLLDELLSIEKELGRERKTSGFESRNIDIDILFYDDQIINTERLTLPHPRLHLRRFTLEILCEIAPALVHPIFKKDIKTLLKECADDKKVLPL